MDSDTETPSPATEPPAPSKTKTTPFPGREDCWSAEATRTLIEAWGERYLDLSRGNLRQKHWQEVADAVNAGHSGGVGGKARRSDVQCKNRIDTLKKKYKIEKARVSDSGGSYTSPWPFFSRLDDLIGPTFSLAKRPAASPSPSPPLPLPPPSAGGSYRNPSPPSWARHSPVPVGPRSFTLKRPAPAAADYSGSGRSFFAFAAAVAAMEEEESESERSRPASGSRLRLSRAERTNGRAAPSPAAAPEILGQLAEAIERFGEIYQRVEHAKQRQIVELEKQRMQFAKDLEYQRMRLFMETQLQIQKIKRAKRSSATAADNYS